MSRLNELRMIARVAQMYYVENQRQADIANHLRMSQATVSRMLKRAQAEEIVRTTVISPLGTYSELEAGLRQTYGLTEAIVVECSEDRDGAIMARIGEAAAHFIEATLQPDEVIGVSSWSETILKMVENIHPMKSGKAKRVVQTMGGMGDPTQWNHQACWRAAAMFLRRASWPRSKRPVALATSVCGFSMPMAPR